MNLYITADQIGGPGGGSAVTFHESEALKTLGARYCEVWGRNDLEGHVAEEPWKWDARAEMMLHLNGIEKVSLTHLYAGTFAGTVAALKRRGSKICYTIAAHDRALSRAEHERWGIPFAQLYPHLCEPALWKRYIEGYRLADVIVCPSKHSEQAVRAYGGEFETKRIEIIPHGCTIPETVKPLPKRFTVGYLGAVGPDKGLVYLLQAWKKLAWKDSMLVIGGRESLSEGVYRMVEQFGGSNICLTGWVDNVADFYGSISLYVQPSVTEGFGMEVLEAMAHGRPVICSTGAGAADVIHSWYRFKVGDVEELVSKIEQVKIRGGAVGIGYPDWREMAADYAWDKIRQRYVDLWRSML